MYRRQLVFVTLLGLLAAGGSCSSGSSGRDAGAAGAHGDASGGAGQGAGDASGVAGTGGAGISGADAADGVAGAGGVAGADSGAGAGGAAGKDAAVDVSGAAGKNDGADASDATNKDAVADVRVDAGKDAAADARVDAGKEAAADVDAGKDAPADVGVDAGKDAGSHAEAGTSLPAPLLHYAFDGDGLNSGSTAGNTLRLNGPITFGSGKIGQAAQFPGGSYAVPDTGARAVLGISPQYTIAFWIKATATPNTTSSFLDFSTLAFAGGGGVQIRYVSATQYTICAATTTNRCLPDGNFPGPTFPAPAANAWHSIILRYAGTGLGAGQGGDLEVYEDDVLAYKAVNDSAKNPVFSPSVSDTLYIGYGGDMQIDDFRVFDTTFTVAEQCTKLIGGTWTGASCTRP